MRRFGIMFLILGIGSFILPLFGVQFILLSIFGEAAPFVGAALAVVGGIMVLLSLRPQGSSSPDYHDTKASTRFTPQEVNRPSAPQPPSNQDPSIEK